MTAAMVASDYKSVPRGALRGFFTLTLASGLVLRSCSLFEKDGRRWVGLPMAPQVDRDGRVKTDTNGKPRYNRLVEFNSKAAFDRFQAEALAAVQAITGTVAR